MSEKEEQKDTKDIATANDFPVVGESLPIRWKDETIRKLLGIKLELKRRGKGKGRRGREGRGRGEEGKPECLFTAWKNKCLFIMCSC